MSTQIAKHVSEEELTGQTFRSVELVNARLKQAESECNLIAPATRVGSLPPGCGVAMCVVRVNPWVDASGTGPDVYKVDGGKLALSKHVLDRISAALGIVWDPRESGRDDDRSHPHYCSYRVNGRYRDLSGRWLSAPGDYELDLRDGSERAAGATPKSLSNMRKFIVARAETGARLRAIAAVGVKRAYQPDELNRPFVIATLHFDGHSDDPETQRILTQETARAMLGGAATLFGAPTTGARDVQARELPASTSRPAVIDAEHEQVERPAQASAKPKPERCYTLPDADDTAVTVADTAKLERWQRRITDDMTDGVYPSEEIPEWNELLAAIAAELTKRRAKAEPKGGY